MPLWGVRCLVLVSIACLFLPLSTSKGHSLFNTCVSFLRLASVEMEQVLEDVLALLKENPAGIPLKKLAVFYNQTYRRNLTLSSLGFKTISCLVESLSEHLVVREDVVFHKIHQPHNQPAAGTPGTATEDNGPATPPRRGARGRTGRAGPSCSAPERDASAHHVPPDAHCLPVHPPAAASTPAETLVSSEDKCTTAVF